jgi:hypothetical protein
MKYRIVKPCIDQDTKKNLQPGDIWEPSSDFEHGRHLAEGNISPDLIERAVESAPETSRRGRPRKKQNVIATNNSSNG